MMIEPIGQSAPSWDECVEILERLPSLPLDSRVQALERLVRNPSPGIRKQALRLGADVLPDSRLTEYLRDGADATLRSAGSEILRLRGGRSLPVVLTLLGDPDSDVVLQAVLILDRMRDPRALEPLHRVLGHSDPNVVQEAVLAIGRLGDARSIPHLLPFLDADLWVQMAAVQALGDLRSPEAVAPLASRLTDPMVGSTAAEALARIGGASAFRALADHWPAGGVEIEDETMLGLLAHVLEGLSSPPEGVPPGLREALAARLHDRSREARAAAARCLLTLGRSAWDAAALEALETSPSTTAILPAALGRRPDLMPRLLGAEGTSRIWGFLLASRFPGEVPADEFFAALSGAGPDLPPATAQALARVHLPGLGGALLDLYLRLPVEGRAILGPALDEHRGELRDALAERSDVDDADRLVLSALLGAPAGDVAEGILRLAAPLRPGAVARLARIEELARVLPWEDWLDEAPELFGAIAAEVAGLYRLVELLPSLRTRVAVVPSPPLLRALGELGDRESVPALARFAESRPDLRSAALEALGRIGGPEARAALRAAALRGVEADVRSAYRALAACAAPEDGALFREAARHPDWAVRAAAIEVLGRFDHPENTATLARLAGDPVTAVAQRALAALGS
jgi:HEAT repeat protein